MTRHRTFVSAMLLALPIWSLPIAPARSQATPPTRVRAYVLAHPIPRGTIVSADDFEPAWLGGAQAQATLSPKDAAGREAVRDLATGVPLHGGDLIGPRLVRRGEPVTITIRSPGLQIVSDGRSLSAGGKGDVVRVFSLSTNRTLDAVVDGPSAVSIRTP